MPTFRTAADTAAALGLTAKALRVWERAGLLKPGRTPAGWRAYGPDDLSRIHQILALRNLGLDLASIGRLLKGRFADLGAVLEVQERALRERRAEVDRGLKLVAAARARLAKGDALSADDLTTLIRETAMTDQQPEWAKSMEPLVHKHFTPEDLADLKARAPDAAEQGRIGQAWTELIADAERAKAKGDPGSPEALDVARRWMVLQDAFTGGDPKYHAKAGAVWAESLADPKFAAQLPFSPDLIDFVRAAKAKLTDR